MTTSTKKGGRPRVGPPVTIALTHELLAWIDAKVPPGGTRAAEIRAVLQAKMESEWAEPVTK